MLGSILTASGWEELFCVLQDGVASGVLIFIVLSFVQVHLHLVAEETMPSVSIIL